MGMPQHVGQRLGGYPVGGPPRPTPEVVQDQQLYRCSTGWAARWRSGLSPHGVAKAPTKPRPSSTGGRSSSTNPRMSAIAAATLRSSSRSNSADSAGVVVASRLAAAALSITPVIAVQGRHASPGAVAGVPPLEQRSAPLATPLATSRATSSTGGTRRRSRSRSRTTTECRGSGRSPTRCVICRSRRTRRCE